MLVDCSCKTAEDTPEIAPRVLTDDKKATAVAPTEEGEPIPTGSSSSSSSSSSTGQMPAYYPNSLELSSLR